MTTNQRVLAISGLAAGSIFGIAGSMVAASNVRAVYWAIDATGLIVATVILALNYLRIGKVDLASGFLVYALGEGIMLTGTSMSLEASVPAFAAGTALWSAGLALVSVPREFPLLTRMIGLAAAIAFGQISLRIFWGVPLTPLSRPLPFFAYPFLVLTFIGWIIAILRQGKKETQAGALAEQRRETAATVR